MKRSEINAIIRHAKEFCAEMKFALPPFVNWTPADWNEKGPECAEIVDNQLGWDITDFGSGDFDKIGLTIFTFRNGKGLYIYPRRGCPTSVDGVTLDSRADSHRYPMQHGSILCVGNAVLQLGVFAGLDVQHFNGVWQQPMDPDAGFVPNFTPDPEVSGAAPQAFPDPMAFAPQPPMHDPTVGVAPMPPYPPQPPYSWQPPYPPEGGEQP